MATLPQDFLNRLEQIIHKQLISNVLESFENPKMQAFRVNTLKDETADYPILEGWQGTFVGDKADERLGAKMEQGQIYSQGLSSQLAPLILDPQPGERILDLCAAPGSKTSQIAALMKNTGEIVAVESVRARMYKLKSVLSLLGVTNVHIHLGDGRRYVSSELFDRILVDAPCSSEGRFHVSRPKSYAYWSKRKIREMRKKQKGLLRHATRLIRPGGIIVYATCTFAPEENEEVVDWILRKSECPLAIEEINVPLATYPSIQHWADKTYHDDIQKTVRILPTDRVDGFFITKFRRVLD